MKTIALVRFAAVALFAGAPLMAHSADSDVVQLCMDKFAAENFADRATSFKVTGEDIQMLPLILRSGTRHVQLTASQRDSGQVLAKANCAVRGDVATLTEVIIATPIVDR